MSEFSAVMQDAINDQINNELFSSYAYLSMAAYLEHQQFLGSAQWMKLQSAEERDHAMRLYDFLNARGGRVKLRTLDQPPTDFEGIQDVFEQAMQQEQRVTKQIESLYELAFKEKAFAALVELEWFIREQVEEEKSLRDILHKFRLVDGDGPSLLDLDRELGERPAEEGSDG